MATAISELSQLNQATDTDLFIISHLSGESYVTRSLSAGNFATKSFVENTYKTYDYISAQLSNNGYMTSAQVAEQQYVTSTDVSAMISSTIGNINSILEEINAGNMQIGSMIDQLNGIEA